MCVHNRVCVNIDAWSQGGAPPAADPQQWQLQGNLGQVDVNLTRKQTRLALSGDDCGQHDLKPSTFPQTRGRQSSLWRAARQSQMAASDGNTEVLPTTSPANPPSCMSVFPVAKRRLPCSNSERALATSAGESPLSPVNNNSDTEQTPQWRTSTMQL